MPFHGILLYYNIMIDTGILKFVSLNIHEVIIGLLFVVVFVLITKNLRLIDVTGYPMYLNGFIIGWV